MSDGSAEAERVRASDGESRGSAGFADLTAKLRNKRFVAFGHKYADLFTNCHADVHCDSDANAR